MIIIYSTFSNKEEAENIAKILLQKRLIACVNYFPIKSFYWWQGKIEESKEIGMFIKTLKINFSKVKKLIKKHHSYATPCIISWKIDKADKKYFNWLKRELN